MLSNNGLFDEFAPGIANYDGNKIKYPIDLNGEFDPQLILANLYAGRFYYDGSTGTDIEMSGDAHDVGYVSTIDDKIIERRNEVREHYKNRGLYHGEASFTQLLRDIETQVGNMMRQR
jgi:hypothetical protein